MYGRERLIWLLKEALFDSVDKVEPYIDIGGEYYTKPQSNADRIRAMSDEELAEWLCGVYDEDEDCAKFINGYYIPCYDQYSIKEWLEQPAEEGEDERSQ